MNIEELVRDLKEAALKATPGPWHVGHVSEIDHDVADIDGDDGTTVANDVKTHNGAFLCEANPKNILEICEYIEKLK